jgi:hypothetical protein
MLLAAKMEEVTEDIISTHEAFLYTHVVGLESMYDKCKMKVVVTEVRYLFFIYFLFL